MNFEIDLLKRVENCSSIYLCPCTIFELKIPDSFFSSCILNNSWFWMFQKFPYLVSKNMLFLFLSTINKVQSGPTCDQSNNICTDPLESNIHMHDACFVHKTIKFNTTWVLLFNHISQLGRFNETVNCYPNSVPRLPIFYPLIKTDWEKDKQVSENDTRACSFFV